VHEENWFVEMNHPTLVIRNNDGSFYNIYNERTGYIGSAYRYWSSVAFYEASYRGAEVWWLKPDGAIVKLPPQQYDRCMLKMKPR